MAEEKNGGVKKVMVAIDESECSLYALKWTFDHLKTSASEIVVFTAMPQSELSYVYASSFGTAPADLIRSIQERQKEAASDLLEKAKEMCANHGVRAETIALAGDPKADLVNSICALANVGCNSFLLLQGFSGKCEQLLCS